MAGCEMCGKQENLRKVRIEGVVMDVCSGCSGYGTPLMSQQVSAPSGHSRPVRRVRVDPLSEVKRLVSDYGARIKRKRESMGMRQADLARFLNEKESLVHQIESQHMKPSEQLIAKISEKMGVELTGEVTEDSYDAQSGQSGLTIGDLLKVK